MIILLAIFIHVKGHLHVHADFWENTLKVPGYILDVIRNGYKIPFLQIPKSYFMKNSRSAFCHSEFVTEAIADFVTSGVVLEVPFVPYIVSPLSVAVNSVGKKKLILNLSTLNRFSWKEHFKFEG